MAEEAKDDPGRRSEDPVPAAGADRHQGAEEHQQATALETGPTPVTTGDRCAQLLVPKSKSRRKDKGHFHAVRHGVLSRFPLEALQRLGEDPKNLRRLENRFRTELKPRGVIADFWFDRFWSNYLRCLLAARTEVSAFLPGSQRSSEATPVPALVAGDLPTLVTGEGQKLNLPLETLKPDILHHLALAQRYDRHVSNEMFRALAMLLILRRSGIEGLEQAMAFTFGIER